MAAAASVPWSDNPAAFRDWQIGRMIELSRGLREPALHVYASKNIAVRACDTCTWMFSWRFCTTLGLIDYNYEVGWLMLALSRR